MVKFDEQIAYVVGAFNNVEAEAGLLEKIKFATRWKCIFRFGQPLDRWPLFRRKRKPVQIIWSNLSNTTVEKWMQCQHFPQRRFKGGTVEATSEAEPDMAIDRIRWNVVREEILLKRRKR